MPDFLQTPQLTPELPDTSIDPASASVAGLRQAMAEGRLTATALTRYYLDRIEQLNPALHAVISVSPDAIAEAEACDRARESGEPRGPLDGIPVLVKDNVQVAGMPTTAGSPALLNAEPGDAFIVSRLRQAGAVILAKANLTAARPGRVRGRRPASPRASRPSRSAPRRTVPSCPRRAPAAWWASSRRRVW